MTPRPEVQQLLDQVAAAGDPSLQELDVAEARAASRRLIDALAGPPAAVAAVEPLTWPGPAGPLPAMVYRPAEPSTDPPPVVVAFHGGGWVLGSVEEHDVVARSLAAESGATVVSVGYRLAPEHPFPAALEDCLAATAWVAEHGAGLGVDATRLALSGDSAGGNLAAAVALAARDRDGPAIVFQLLTYPALDATMALPSHTSEGNGYLLTADTVTWCWDHYLGPDGDRADPLASPLHAPDLRGLPPALVITAEHDPLRDEGEAYARRLRDAGVAARTSRYLGMIHGFAAMGAVLPQAARALAEAGHALRVGLELHPPQGPARETAQGPTGVAHHGLDRGPGR